MENYSIMVIDDNSQIREDISFLLSMEGLRVIQYSDGLDIIEKLKQNNPDLILCDIMMPEIDGYQVLKKVREDSGYSSIPFVFLTAKASKDDFREGMGYGADDYLTKPFTSEELMRCIYTRLKRKRQIQGPVKNKLDSLAKQLEARDPSAIHSLEEIEREFRSEGKWNSYSIVTLRVDRYSHIRVGLGNEVIRSIVDGKSVALMQVGPGRIKFFHSEPSEFIILTPSDGSELMQEVHLYLEIFSRPIEIGDRTFRLSISCGVADREKVPGDVRLESAIAAAHEASEDGGGQIVVCESEKHIALKHEMQIESDLQNALERNELSWVLQPRWKENGTKVGGFEVLMRWTHPEFGNISPVKFIRIAEETGLIKKLGYWIFEEAVAFLSEKLEKHDVFLSVNVTFLQIKEEDFADRIIELLGKYGVPSNKVEIEITESGLVATGEAVLENLHRFREAGVSISVDDFGTGFASYSYLKRIPFTHLKIDRSFVKDLEESVSDPVIDSIIDLGHRLGLNVVAEGVETEKQLEYLKARKVDQFQGYLLAKPMPPEEAKDLLLELQEVQS